MTEEQIRLLRASFPAEALSADTSRGFELTSIKAAYIIERLNDVFGTYGSGWRYSHAPFETIVTADERTEILTEVALQYRLAAEEQGGAPPVDWRDHWHFDPDRARIWSEPVYAVGGHSLGRGSVPYTDARKSAVTDGLTKAASMLGIGHQVFKGLIRSGGDNGNGHEPSSGNDRGDNGADPTAFWALYNREGKAAGISLESAKDLAGRGNWATALVALRSMIDQAAVAVR